MKKDPLKSYQEKRNFGVTSEPMGGEAHATSENIFVVQKHAARRLHYDLRLEVNGVLRSWAVPRGPSMDPKEKRLAVETEDHPIGYASFEGTIPEGQYGAGSVIVWDKGNYRNMTEKEGRAVPMNEALKKGHAAFWLAGKKLRGGFALTRTQRGWILVKMKDELADSSRDILKDEPRSVKSGRTVEEVGRD